MIQLPTLPTGDPTSDEFFLSRGSFRLLLPLPFCLLFLLFELLFPTLVLILLSFVSHLVPPFPLVAHFLGWPWM